jgi:hypothetical protein
MKTQSKIKIAKKSKKRRTIWEIAENIKEFFPPVSRMGNTAPSYWKQLEPKSFQRTVKAPF